MLQDSGIYMSTPTFSTSSSFSSCHPACADLDCSSRGTRRCGSSCSSSPSSSSEGHAANRRSHSTDSQPFVSWSFHVFLPTDSSSPQYLKRKTAREEWCLGPALVSLELFSPAVRITHSSTPLHTGESFPWQFSLKYFQLWRLSESNGYWLPQPHLNKCLSWCWCHCRSQIMQAAFQVPHQQNFGSVANQDTWFHLEGSE